VITVKNKVVGLIIVLVLGLIGWRVYQKVAGPAGGMPVRQDRNGAVAVVVQPVLKEPIRDLRQFTGSVVPRAQFVVAPKVAGRLEHLLVNIGQTVSNGQLVATLDSLEYDQQVKQARAELEVAQANVVDSQSALDIAVRELARARELRRQQVASEAEMDQADARHRAAQAKNAVTLAQVKQGEAVLKAAEVRLSYTRIAAAWEGVDGDRVIGERMVDEGAMLRANDPIVSVLDIGTVIAAIFVVERDYPRIQVGQSAVVETDAYPGRTFTGKIVRKAPLLKESSRQARVEIDIANPERLLAPGMFIRVEIQFALHDNATVVPVAALARRDGKAGVFLADQTAMTVRFVPVTVGIVSGDRAEIVAPPIEGRVVTMGQHLLEDGSRITIPGDRPTPERPADRGAGEAGGKGKGGRP
jgi:RND family efflux transporter MFP subunit